MISAVSASLPTSGVGCVGRLLLLGFNGETYSYAPVHLTSTCQVSFSTHSASSAIDLFALSETRAGTELYPVLSAAIAHQMPRPNVGEHSGATGGGVRIVLYRSQRFKRRPIVGTRVLRDNNVTLFDGRKHHVNHEASAEVNSNRA